MKKFLLMAAVLFIAGAAAAQTDEKFPSYIEVSGYAERNVTPDTFYITIVINETDSKGKIPVETQQRDMIKALKSLGIDTDKQFTMVDMTGEYILKRKNTLLTAEYRLKLNSAAEVSSVYGALSDLGISNVLLRSVSYSKMAEVRNEVRVESIRNARAKAAMLAEGIDQKIGNCIRINDYSYDGSDEVASYPMRSVKMMANAEVAMDVAEEETLEFRSIKVAASVNARFVLLDAKGNNIFYH